jgi:hypothetical protein
LPDAAKRLAPENYSTVIGGVEYFPRYFALFAQVEAVACAHAGKLTRSCKESRIDDKREELAFARLAIFCFDERPSPRSAD